VTRARYSLKFEQALTLIELLAIITILGIITAILYPITAQARLAAMRSADLQNVKQLALAHQQYWQDHDDRTVSSWSNGIAGDFSFAVGDYLNDRASLHSPVRNITNSEAADGCGISQLHPGNSYNPMAETWMYGYGYNVGHEFYSGQGLLQVVRWSPGRRHYPFPTRTGHTLVSYRAPYMMIGRSLSEITTPAQVFLLSNTGHASSQGMHRRAITPLEWFHMEGASVTPCELVMKRGFPAWRYGINVAFVDGHAQYERLVRERFTLWDENPRGLPIARQKQRLFRNPCGYFYNTTGENNPGACRTGDGNAY
jgi:prepilin-type processing-associated H-X9-DG protein